jgi:hypothetical protein
VPRAISAAIPHNVFGRPDDEITSDFQIPPDEEEGAAYTQPQPRLDPVAQPPGWRPLVDEESATSPEAEPLLDALLRGSETVPDDERGGGQAGLH